MNLKKSAYVFIDFETYYDTKFSLKKLTIEEYINHKDFETIGLSIKFKLPNEIQIPTKFHKGELGIKTLKTALEKLLFNKDIDKVFLISHNGYFDFAVLAFKYDFFNQLKALFNPKTQPYLYSLKKLVLGDTALNAATLGQHLYHFPNPPSASLKNLSKLLFPNEEGKKTFLEEGKGIGKHLKDFTEEELKEYASYCIQDTELCSKIWDKQLFDEALTITELTLIDATLRMFIQPRFMLDTSKLKTYKQSLRTDKEQELKRLNEVFKQPFSFADLRSNAKFLTLLKLLTPPPLNDLIPLKWSEKQKKEIPAFSKTDKEFLDFIEKSKLTPTTQAIADLCELKLKSSSSIEETRAETFLNIAQRNNGFMPIYLKYFSAHTGRYGGGEKTNFQNLSKRTRDPVLRRSLIAPPNQKVIACDSSQIEARVLAYIAGEQDLIDAFLAKKDPYIQMATKIFPKFSYDEIYELSKGANPTKEGKRMRNLSKEVVLAAGYSMSANTFKDRMLLSGNTEAAGMAEELIAAYRKANPKIVKFWKTCGDVLAMLYAGKNFKFGAYNMFYGSGQRRDNPIAFIQLPNKTKLFYPNLRRDPDNPNSFIYSFNSKGKWEDKRLWNGLLAENITQSLAFALLKYQALQIYKKGIPLSLNVHDEWVSVIPDELIEKVALIFREAMTKSPPYFQKGLFDCEVSIGDNYADLKTFTFED